MSKLGATLKNKRETLSIDVDKATEDTRISADIIAVLENGEYKGMPSYNHAKNFVKNYAEYLGLDQEKVTELFDQECTKEDFYRDVKYVAAPVTREAGGSPAAGMKFLIPAIIVIVILFAGYKVFQAMKKGDELRAAAVIAEVKKEASTLDTPVDQAEVKEVIESIKTDTVSEPLEGAVKQPEVQTEQIPAVKKEEPSMSAFLPDKKDEPKADAKLAVVNFADVCWVHIKIDGKEEIDFIAEKGNQREITFHDHFLMDIGNAAVVSLSYNNRTIAGLGAYKQPVKGLKFTVNEDNRLIYTTVK
jgi:cytoskeletal protein RodZ